MLTDPGCALRPQSTFFRPTADLLQHLLHEGDIAERPQAGLSLSTAIMAPVSMVSMPRSFATLLTSGPFVGLSEAAVGPH
ncbi:MAG: hypothetical protein CM1200mP20_06730 [Pseudomonadota bacterium]|nr:MAG: hypothetical protein CM1200mP20_06730 [Pseudomonadota bacterium]